MQQVQLSLTPAISGLLGVEANAVAIPLPEGHSRSLREVLQLLEQQSPGALLEPSTGRLRRHIHVRINHRLVSELNREIKPEDMVRVSLRLIEGG